MQNMGNRRGSEILDKDELRIKENQGNTFDETWQRNKATRGYKWTDYSRTNPALTLASTMAPNGFLFPSSQL